jgi:hypothetical protein
MYLLWQLYYSMHMIQLNDNMATLISTFTHPFRDLMVTRSDHGCRRGLLRCIS